MMKITRHVVVVVVALGAVACGGLDDEVSIEESEVRSSRLEFRMLAPKVSRRLTAILNSAKISSRCERDIAAAHVVQKRVDLLSLRVPVPERRFPDVATLVNENAQCEELEDVMDQLNDLEEVADFELAMCVGDMGAPSTPVSPSDPPSVCADGSGPLGFPPMDNGDCSEAVEVMDDIIEAKSIIREWMRNQGC